MLAPAIFFLGDSVFFAIGLAAPSIFPRAELFFYRGGEFCIFSMPPTMCDTVLLAIVRALADCAVTLRVVFILHFDLLKTFNSLYM